MIYGIVMGPEIAAYAFVVLVFAVFGLREVEKLSKSFRAIKKNLRQEPGKVKA